MINVTDTADVAVMIHVTTTFRVVAITPAMDFHVTAITNVMDTARATVTTHVIQ
jgi:hypothetical protein